MELKSLLIELRQKFNASDSYVKFFTILFVVIIVILIALLFMVPSLPSKIQKANSTLQSQSTTITMLSTSDTMINNKLSNAFGQLDYLKTMVITLTTPSTIPTITPTIDSTPQPTLKWFTTSSGGFSNDVDIDSPNVEVDIDHMSANGYFYTPLEGINSLEFNLLISKFPTLPNNESIYEESKYNYHLVVGIGNMDNFSNNADNDINVQAKIYPYFDKSRNSWNHFKIASQSTYLEDEELYPLKNIELNHTIEWKFVQHDNQITITVNDDSISEDIRLDKFTHPVLYVGYFQSNNCTERCPVKFCINGVKVDYTSTD